MSELYIGGERRRKSGIKWKLYLFLFTFVMILGGALKLSAPFIAEKWLNHHGSGNLGYAYSVREVELSLKAGELTLKDVKVFNPESNVKLIESPNLNLKMNLKNVFKAGERRVSITADRLDIFISTELISEINRITKSKRNEYMYFTLVDGHFSEINIIEKKPDESRRLVKLHDAKVNMKELSALSVNEKTEFTLSSKLADGGEMNLSGSMNEEEGESFWMIEGFLKEFSPDLFNKLAGSDLPFSFNESALNAKIVARSNKGQIEGEILPEVTRLNLINERPGFTREVIARALTEELTFSLPFTLKDELNLEYADTYKKLKDYRKYPVSVVSSR